MTENISSLVLKNLHMLTTPARGHETEFILYLVEQP